MCLTIQIRDNLFSKHPFDPRFRILETTVQMLDKQVVNNNFYCVFLSICANRNIAIWWPPFCL